ncbi:ABC transporter permease [Methylacidimicrobium sp. B4]|uniref:ABC transporter permease n=1 Tax=Methylacidimicrobium sp. B4 TaxID=2796139 RepID=UPI001A8EF5F2|nr:ABC transporter permease [Methylacidimicrobium sp. B4]QSR84520.1 ABC transporter permease subunit [Methylacidimicrobium sp. B4]
MVLWVLIQREVRSFFHSPTAYIVLFACALIHGLNFAFWLEYMTSNNIKDFTLLQATVNSFFFWFLLLIQAPVLTMRSFAEENRSGTIEMILTAPVREWELVLAKFVGAMSFFCVLWLPLALDFFGLRILWGHPLGMTGSMDLLSLLMLLLLGSLFLAIGIFASCLTRSQMVAAILSFGAIFAIFSLSFVVYLGLIGQTRDLVTYFSFLDQMDTFSRGIFDSRPLVLTLSGTALFLFLTERVLQWRRLRS